MKRTSLHHKLTFSSRAILLFLQLAVLILKCLVALNEFLHLTSFLDILLLQILNLVSKFLALNGTNTLALSKLCLV